MRSAGPNFLKICPCLTGSSLSWGRSPPPHLPMCSSSHCELPNEVSFACLLFSSSSPMAEEERLTNFTFVIIVQREAIACSRLDHHSLIMKQLMQHLQGHHSRVTHADRTKLPACLILHISFRYFGLLMSMQVSSNPYRLSLCKLFVSFK